jgi:hypothetical protein
VVTKFLGNFNAVTTVTTSTTRNNFPIEKCVTIPGLFFSIRMFGKGGDSGDSGDNVDVKGEFLSPP